MLSSMDSWLAWRSVRLGISTARPVSVLLWMAPFSLRLSPSGQRGQERWGERHGEGGDREARHLVSIRLWPPSSSLSPASPAPTLPGQPALHTHRTHSFTCILSTDGFVYVDCFSPLNSLLCNSSKSLFLLFFSCYRLSTYYVSLSPQVLCMDLDQGFSTPAQLDGDRFVVRGVLCIDSLTVSLASAQ